jgi:two-component system sensor histidine kinase KdpD
LILVDGLLVEQVLVNLLENAARYTPPGTPILISAARQAKTISIVVRDHGPGFGQGEVERLFEKFYQSPERRPDSRRGVGLGLAICRAIIKAHHGTITAINAEPHGALFEIRLPLLEPPAN